jgi:anti-sigma regulatory factor (Ser/Thr protein kinase)
MIMAVHYNKVLFLIVGMIDITRTRAQLLAELEARGPGASPLVIPSRVPLRADAHLLFRGNAVKETFSLLKAELSERFAGVPRPQLIRDLLVPLKNALGNAYKHGNRRDRAKAILVQIVLTRKGALIAITDEGSGFDVASTVHAMSAGRLEPSDRGAGLRNLERAHSVVCYENGGRTVLLCFRPEVGSTESPQSPDGPGRDPALLKILDPEWMRRCLSTELPDFRDNQAKLRECRPYPAKGIANDHCGIRYILEIGWPSDRPAEMRILTGRLHADAAAAEADFEAATKLYESLRSRQLQVPQPVARLEAEPQLVLYDFDPWMNLWEYLDDRGSPKVLRDCAEWAGQALAALHQSHVQLRMAEPRSLAERLQLTCARVSSNLLALGFDFDLAQRARTILQSIEERFAMLESRQLAPTHSALGWDCIHYGVDRGFYLYRFENCRLSHPGLDLGAFLADVLLFSATQNDEEAFRIGRDAFIGSYDALAGQPTSAETLRTCTAVALLDRLDQLLPRLEPDLRFHAALVIGQCERVLKGAPAL